MSAAALRKKTSKSFGKRSPLPVRKSASVSARRSRAAFSAPVNETMDAFVKWVNETYNLQLPTLSDFTPVTILYQMWSLSVDVTNNPSPGVVASAKATTSLAIVAKLSGIVFMDVRQASITGATG